MTDEVGELAGANDERRAPTMRTMWLVMGGAMALSLLVFVIGIAISTPTNITSNAQGAIIVSGGTSLLVPFGVLSLGVSILVTQITVRTTPSKLMPIAWAISGGLAATSLIAIIEVGPALIPSGAACVAGCVLARRRAQMPGA